MKQWGPVSAGFLFLAVVCPAQVQLGQFTLGGNGTLSAGYTGNYGNLTSSDHGVTFGGAGTLSGSFYSPNFLSFSVQPFLNQSRENSNYQSISNTSGVNANTSIFAGSYFPGTAGYSKTFNSQGTFAVPGVANFTSHGDSQVISLGWSENVPTLPSVSVSFLDGNDHYSLYGANGDLSSVYRSVQLQSNYRVAGFSLTGSFRDSNSQSQVPEILGGTAETNDTHIDSYSFGISHRLPFHGSFSASASRSDINADFSTGAYHAAIDSLNGGISFSPIGNLNIGATYQYIDDLAGSLDQAIVAAGGAVAGNQESTHSMSVTAFANYTVTPLHLVFSANDEYRDQAFLGQTYQSESQTASVTYSNSLLGGFFNATAGVGRSSVSSSDQKQLGLMGSINYSREVKGWSTSAMVHYSQNTETALIGYTANGYGYSGSLGRKLSKKSHWSASAAGSRSTLSNQPGASTFSQSYSTVVSVKWLGVSGAYSKSSGDSILTSSGLVPVSLPVAVVAPSSVILYGGTAWSGGIGITPFRGFTLSASYSRALSSTQGDAIDSNNRTQQLNAYLQYQLRKVYVTAGYSKLEQSFSSNGNVPAMVGTFYFGLSRWFNFL